MITGGCTFEPLTHQAGRCYTRASSFPWFCRFVNDAKVVLAAGLLWIESASSVVPDEMSMTAMTTISTELESLAPMPEFSEADWPSYLYLLLFACNTAAIGWLADTWYCVGFVLLQGCFLAGMLELNHQAVHRRFVLNSSINEALGTIAAALIGFNFTAYRYFHLEHHRHTCDEIDPEGLLYAESPATRWFWLGAPIAHLVVAWEINGLASRYVPASKRAEWMRSNSVRVIVFLVLILWAIVSPRTFLLAYILPLCLFGWIDFLFSQAEHYAAPVRPVAERVNVASVTLDVRLPRWLSHLLLNRNLHRVHHVWPRTRWFEAPGFLTTLNGAQPGRVVSLPEFAARWYSEGPRLWQ